MPKYYLLNLKINITFFIFQEIDQIKKYIELNLCLYKKKDIIFISYKYNFQFIR
jgi:hypothetical protein